VEEMVQGGWRENTGHEEQEKTMRRNKLGWEVPCRRGRR